MSEHSEQFLDDLATSRSSHLPFLKALFRVGSQMYGTPTTDLDFLFVTTASRAETTSKLEEFLYQNFEFESLDISDDAVQVTLKKGTPPVSLSIYTEDYLTGVLTTFADGTNVYGQHRPWANGYWLPEGLASEIQHAGLLVGDDYLTYLRSLINPYPEAARAAIIDLCQQEIALKTASAGRQDGWMKSLSLAEAKLAEIRKAFAEERFFLRSFKKLDQQAARSKNPKLIDFVASL